MLSRLFSTTSRLSLTTTVRFFQFSARNTVRKNGESFKFAEKFGLFGLRSHGQAIKKRLLARTTGKPYVYGAIALAGASVVGIGALMYYGLSSKESSILEQSANFSPGVRKYISTTYGYLLASLGITAATAFAVSRNRSLLCYMVKLLRKNYAFFVVLPVMLSSIALCISIDYDKPFSKHAAWLLQAGLWGALSAPWSLSGGPVVLRAALLTFAIVAGLSTIAITAPSEKFLKWSAPLGIALSVICVAIIASVFVPSFTALAASLDSFVLFGGLILFSIYIVHDTQRIVKNAIEHDEWIKKRKGRTAYFDPINEQMHMYLDVLIILGKILRLVDAGEKAEKRSRRRR